MEAKPGWKSTEFLLTLGMNFAAVLATVSDVLPPKWAAITLVVSNGLYALSRGFAKGNQK